MIPQGYPLYLRWERRARLVVGWGHSSGGNGDTLRPVIVTEGMCMELPDDAEWELIEPVLHRERAETVPQGSPTA